ncbi:hypothetical protein MAPG_06279 [Magnaporthiopsis poae ATCC 64411]|uniref:Hsp70-like protein n=1 Tax=Magnaporthiopsis poae (strain ATCC 64411 / 73-15) TaxID=644358 RepID=A0A0C4E1L5_MAGP6|nr:hypothetical protein MAPG_06279 [Magnaporthiopsis poae ATCC 64411]
MHPLHGFQAPSSSNILSFNPPHSFQAPSSPKKILPQPAPKPQLITRSGPGNTRTAMQTSVRGDDKPKLAVAIDFGTTFTKAAIMALIPGYSPNIIEVRDYPSCPRDTRMVPSVLSYSADGESRGGVSFGPEAQNDLDLEGSDRVVYGRFKPKFPSGMVQPLNAPGPMRHVQELYLVMAQAMYLHIRDCYTSVIEAYPGVFFPDWEDIPVEFCFTVPAVGDPQIAGEKLKELARRAGFGSVPGHSVCADVLTEGEASAIYSLMHSKDSRGLENGKTLVVVDVGGATSDLCVLKIVDRDAAQVSLDFADPVRGQQIGSTKVNEELEQLLSQFLAGRVDDPVSWARAITSLPDVEEMKVQVCSGVQKDEDLKIGLPERAILQTGTQGASAPELSIAGLSMDDNVVKIKSDLMRRLVDTQVLGTGARGEMCLKRQLDAVIEDVMIKRPEGASAEVDRILWSGGFGSSAYVRGQLQKRLVEERDCDPQRSWAPVHSNIKGLDFSVSSDPQLCVCKGALYHWLKDRETSRPGQAESAQAQKKQKGSWWRRLFGRQKRGAGPKTAQ